MEIFTFLAPLLGKLQDPAVLVPTLGFIFLGYLHVVWRREEREDRRAMLQVVADLTQALNEVRITIAAITGRAA